MSAARFRAPREPKPPLKRQKAPPHFPRRGRGEFEPVVAVVPRVGRRPWNPITRRRKTEEEA